MWNNSYRTPTEPCGAEDHRLPKGKEIPHIHGEGKRKKKKRQKNRDRTCASGRELWRRKSFHTLGNPFTGGDRGVWGVSFGATEESIATGVQRAKQRDFHTEDRWRPALTSLRCLSAHLPGQMGAGSWGSGFGVQTPRRGWGWLCEHSLKGASSSQLAGREYRKKSGPAREARDHCLRVCKEGTFLIRVPTDDRGTPKWAPEMGMSCGYHLGPQRRAWTTTAATTATKDPVCKYRSLPTPSRILCNTPLPGFCDSGTTSSGEHMACLKLLQRHTRLCCCRLATHSNYDYHTPPSPEWARET